MSTSASPVHLLSNVGAKTLDLKAFCERAMEIPEQPKSEQVQVDELARAERILFQSRRKHDSAYQTGDIFSIRKAHSELEES